MQELTETMCEQSIVLRNIPTIACPSSPILSADQSASADFP